MSNATAAALANAVLEDYGVINSENRSSVISPCKIAYERKRQRKSRREQEISATDQVSSIYFDGKKTATRSMQHNEKTGTHIK